MTTVTKRFRVHERCPQRAYTTDAERSRDAILSAVTPAESAANAKRVAALTGLDLGTRWTGDLKPVGRAVAEVVDAITRVGDRKRRSAAVSDAIAEIAAAAYGGSFETSEAASGGGYGELVFSPPTGRPQKEFGSAMTPDELNAIHEQHYSEDRSTRSAAKDSAVLSTRATGESINEANRRFWDGQPTQPGRPWGKG